MATKRNEANLIKDDDAAHDQFLRDIRTAYREAYTG